MHAGGDTDEGVRESSTQSRGERIGDAFAIIVVVDSTFTTLAAVAYLHNAEIQTLAELRDIS